MIDIYEKLSEFKSKGMDSIIITVTSKEGMGPADVGKKLIVNSNGEFFGTIGGGSIEYYAIERAKKLLVERKSLSENYVLNDKEVLLDSKDIKLNMACGGKATLFYEFVGPKQYVYIFGAGHCGAALAKILKPLGFHVTLIDNREDVLANLDDSYGERILSDFAKFIEEGKLKDNSYLVVATPSHLHDYDVLDKIFETKYRPAYFGMLCSKKKIAEYLDKAYSKFGKDIDLTNFYSPIGLNIGGTSPEEIAISISSEILSVYYGKSRLNSHLRDKK